MEQLIIEVGNYKSKLLGASNFIRDMLVEQFSFIYFERVTSTARPLPIRVNLYAQDNTFYSGLVFLVKKYLKSINYNIEIHNSFIYNNDFDSAIQRIKKNIKLSLRDYQIKTILRTLKFSLSLTSLPTGSGKSLVMAALLLADNCRTLIIVDSKSLMHQLISSIKSMTGRKCGMVGDGIYEPRLWTVAVIDSLLTGKGLEVVKEAKALYFDEAHKTGADTYKRIVDYSGENSIIRRGFTATAFRNDSRSLLLPALTGPVIVHYSTSELIDQGWLAKPTILMPAIRNFQCKANYYNAIYSSCIINNEFRNKTGIISMIDAVKNGELAVGLFRNVQKHMPKLCRLLLSGLNESQIGIIHGHINSKRRKQILDEFADGSRPALLASVGTMGEGIDLPGETTLGVNFVGGVSEVMIRQMLGRTLRKPKLESGDVDTDVPFNVTYIDPMDYTHREMLRQAQERYNIYMSEPSFEVECLGE